jgi:hypothetical protein
MISIILFSFSLIFGILAGVNKIIIPDPFIPALLGVALFSIAAFIKRKKGWHTSLSGDKGMGISNVPGRARPAQASQIEIHLGGQRG